MSDVSHLREPSKTVRISTREVIKIELNSELLPIEWDYMLNLADKMEGYSITNIALDNGRRYAVVTLMRGTNIVEGYTPASYKLEDIDGGLPGIEIINADETPSDDETSTEKVLSNDHSEHIHVAYTGAPIQNLGINKVTYGTLSTSKLVNWANSGTPLTPKDIDDLCP